MVVEAAQITPKAKIDTAKRMAMLPSRNAPISNACSRFQRCRISLASHPHAPQFLTPLTPQTTAIWKHCAKLSDNRAAEPVWRAHLGGDFVGPAADFVEIPACQQTKGHRGGKRIAGPDGISQQDRQTGMLG